MVPVSPNLRRKKLQLVMSMAGYRPPCVYLATNLLASEWSDASLMGLKLIDLSSGS